MRFIIQFVTNRMNEIQCTDNVVYYVTDQCLAKLKLNYEMPRPTNAERLVLQGTWAVYH